MKSLSHYACQWLLLVCGLTASISASATGRDEVVFYFNDALGSAVAAVSESGNLCWSEVYSGYGEKTIDSDYGLNGVGCGVLGQERGYTGHTQDWETDLVYMQQRYYDASIGRFLSIDPIDTNPGQPQTYNRYAYGNNNPYRYTDPTGEIPFDTIFDAVSVVYDLGKIGVGYSTGNSALVSEGVIDLTGDIGALLTPYVPAGGTKVARALAKADSKVPNKPDFVVGTNGTTIPTSQSRMREGFDEAGFPSQDVISPTSGNLVGQAHTLPDGNIVRTMMPDGRNPRRASFTNGNGGAINPSTGKPIQPPSGMTRAERKQFVRERSHVEQSP